MLRPPLRPLMLKIDDSHPAAREFAVAVATTTRRRLLVVLAPPLLSELASRLLSRSDIEVVVPDDDGFPPPGMRYDGVVRNVSLPQEVAVALVVDLPSPDGSPVPTVDGDVVVLERLGEVVDLLARRWPADAAVAEGPR
jgi:hypothetical protein